MAFFQFSFFPHYFSNFQLYFAIFSWIITLTGLFTRLLPLIYRIEAKKIKFSFDLKAVV